MALTTDPADSRTFAAAPPAPSRAAGLVDRADLTGGVVAAVVALLLGAPVGLLWQALAPRAEMAAFGSGSFRLVNVEDRAFIGQDLLLFTVCVGAGLALGVLGWVLGRHRAVGVVIGLVIGGFAAAWVAQRVGVLVDAGRGSSFAAGTRSAADGLPLKLPNEILRSTHRSPLLLLGWPAGSALAFAALAVWRFDSADGPAPGQPAVPTAPQPHH